MITNRMKSLSESATLAITAKANELKSQGKKIVSFSAGEPDFDTPNLIKKEAIKAINDGFTKYTGVDGILPLKEAIVNKLKRDNNLIYNVNDIIVSNGAKHSLFNIFQALIDDKDEVIIPTPYWVTYPDVVSYCGGKSVFVETTYSQNYKISPKKLENSIGNKSKVLVLNTPSNPTGAIYSKKELEAIANVLKGTDIMVISDEMYEKLYYNEGFISVPSISEDMYNRTILVNGLSKSVAMTGWRMGYLATPKSDIVKSIKKLQSQSTSNINSITQKASIVALSDDVEKDISYMRDEFKKRRDFAVDKFNNIDGVSVISPDGAFYLFVNISEIEKDSTYFCKDILEKKEVALVPGIAFGMEGHFRFSFATDTSTIKEGIDRIRSYIEENYR